MEMLDPSADEIRNWGNSVIDLMTASRRVSRVKTCDGTPRWSADGTKIFPRQNSGALSAFAHLPARSF
jgi:hypothetical protein